MRILHTADWHLGKRLESFSRLPEQKEVLEEISEIADREKVDIILIAGDLFDTYNPSIEAVELLYKTLKKLTAGGMRAVIAIAGNHDSPERIEAPDPLARECGIFFAGFPDSFISDTLLESGIRISGKAKGVVEVKMPHYSYPFRLIFTPYANEYRLKTCFDSEDAEEELREMLKKHWKTLSNEFCDEQGVNFLMTHLFFADKNQPLPEEPEDEKPILHVGGAQVVFSEAVPNQIQYTALGHLHRFQVLGKKEQPLVYSGSPLGYSFSEASQEKFVVVLDAEPAQPVSVRKTGLSAGKKLLRKRFESIPEAIDWFKENPDVLVELTIVTEQFLTGLERKQLFDAHAGIVTIIPEVRNTALMSATEKVNIDPGKDIQLLFKDYFKASKGQSPNEEIMELFREILSEEGEV